MYRISRGKIGVSAVVGGVIVLAIFFVIIVPLLVLMQNSYAIFLNEANSRRIFDMDRLSESLKVEVSQNNKTKNLVLIFSNDGPVYVKVVRVWAIDVARQTSITGEKPCLGEKDVKSLRLAPGSTNKTEIQKCVIGFTGIVRFLAVTERGRIFSSNEIYLKEGRVGDIVFPFTLTVSIINMKKGRLYEVYVMPIGDGKVSPEKFTHKATAANENVTVAFGIFPGNYSVTLYENNKPALVGGGNPQLIKVPENTAIIFVLEPGRITPTFLDVTIISPKRVKDDNSFTVEIDIRLPKNANETVTITSIGSISISHNLPQGQFDYDCESYPGFTISPGERKTAILCNMLIGEIGGRERSITITVPEGIIVGIGDSGKNYINKYGSKTITVIG